MYVSASVSPTPPAQASHRQGCRRPVGAIGRILGLAVALGAAVGGQADTGLLTWTNTWHFNQALNLDGVGWTALSFTNSPPVILSQPADLEVLDGRTAFLSAEVDGSPTPTRQWYRDGVAIAGATGPTVAFAPAHPSQTGQHWLVASNALGTTTTRQASLTVLPDTDAPAIVQALAATNLANITVDFSEPVDSASALTLTNYTVVRSAGGSQALTVVSAGMVTASRIVLGTSARAPNVAYTLGVSGVRDRTSSSNLIASGTLVPLVYAVTLVGIGAPADNR